MANAFSMKDSQTVSICTDNSGGYFFLTNRISIESYHGLATN
jgi:hypothetical protein